LNDEESFWLARRRVGQPQQLGDEFIKANPAKIWRERLFWMVLAWLAFCLWTSLVSCIPLHNWTSGFFGLVSAYAWVVLLYFPPICLAILLAKGKLFERYNTLVAFFKSRLRFAFSIIAFLIVTHGYQALAAYKYRIQTDHGRLAHTLDGFWLNEFSYISWPLMLVVLATWLLPTQNRKTPKRA
jgi:hypothetical protein